MAPLRVLEYLVNEQYLASSLLELGGKLYNAVVGEEEVVHIDEEAGTVRTKLLLGVLQQESCLAYTAGSLDADKSVVPIDLVHKVAANGSIGMLYKVGVCPIE